MGVELMLTTEQHAMQHAALKEQEDRYNRRLQSTYERLKKLHTHAPRKDARLQTRSWRTTLYYSWRSHVQSGHGQKLSAFISFNELQDLHAKLHSKKEG
jgi:hypothetical protein